MKIHNTIKLDTQVIALFDTRDSCLFIPSKMAKALNLKRSMISSTNISLPKNL